VTNVPAPSPAEIGLLAAFALTALTAGLARWRGWGRWQASRPERGWLLGTGVAFAVALVSLLVWHHHQDPHWTPHGADWDAWFQSAVAFQNGLALHPIARWPLNGALAALIDLFVPGPLFVALQIVSLASAAAAVAAIYLLGHLLLGRFAGIAAACLALLQPNCLEIAQWASAYNLWAASACWAAAGLVAALRTRRAHWWVVAGLGITGALATMPKGLLMGGMLLSIALPLAVAWGRPRWGGAAALLAPLVLTAGLYALFPQPLASLDGLVRYARHGDHDSRMARAMDFDLSDGYVFGKSSGPVTLWHTFQAMRDEGGMEPGQSDSPLGGNLVDLQRQYDGGGLLTLAWLGLGLACGLLTSLLRPGERRVGWGWLAVAAVGAAVAPSLWLHLNTRFLLPLFWMLPLLVVAPLALPSRAGPLWLRWLPLLACGALLLPGSPWRFEAERTNPVDVRAPEQSLWLHWGLVSMDDIDPLYACGDPFTNWFALDARGGHSGPWGFDDRKEWELPLPTPDEYLLVRQDPMSVTEGDGGGDYPCDVSGRTELRRFDMGVGEAVLFGPVGAGTP